MHTYCHKIKNTAKFFPESRVPHFCSPPWTPFRGCWVSVAAAARDFILVDVDGKCQFVADTCTADVFFFFLFITHYKILCMLHNTLHNLLAGIEEHDWIVFHQSGKRLLNQCSPNPLTHSHGLLQRPTCLFPSNTTDMNNGQPFFPRPVTEPVDARSGHSPGWTSPRPWRRSRGEPRTTSWCCPPPFFLYLFIFYLLKCIYFFNWRITALQNCVGFCQTSTYLYSIPQESKY